MILSSETTGPNSDRFNRYLRSFLWIDDIILVIDDLASHEEGSYQWLWHPIGTTVKKGVDLDIRNGKAHVVLRQLYPETLAPSDFIHDYPSNMTWEIHNAPGEDNKGDQPYYSFHLPKRHDRVKGVHSSLIRRASQRSNAARVTVGSESESSHTVKLQMSISTSLPTDGLCTWIHGSIRTDGIPMPISQRWHILMTNKHSSTDRHAISSFMAAASGMETVIRFTLSWKKTIKYGNGPTLSAGDLYVIESHRIHILAKFYGWKNLADLWKFHLENQTK